MAAKSGLTFVLTADSLSPEMRAKFEASKVSGKNHPLYETESSSWGKVPRGVVVEPLRKPVAAKAGDFSCHFLPCTNEQRTTLDTTRAKHRYLKELDPM